MADDEVRPWTEVAVRATAKAVPYVGDSALMVVDQVLARRRASGAALMSDIAAASGGEEVVVQRLTIPEVEALFIEGFESALRTGIDAKRRLLAQVISNGGERRGLVGMEFGARTGPGCSDPNGLRAAAPWVASVEL